MDTTKTDEFLRKMFVARGVTLVAGSVILVIGVFSLLPVPWYQILRPLDEVLIEAVVWVALSVVAVGSLVTWYYLFLVAFREAGLKYAVGHLLICMALTPPALLGIIFIPLQIYNDIDRWRQAAVDS